MADENQSLTAPTLETLTLEIKYHLRLAAQSVIEVGNRLILAKDLVPHGHWADWLNKNFKLKKSSAANFMSIAKRFGGSNFQTSGNFNQSQFVELLKLAPGDEEKFVAAMKSKGTPIETLTIKKLRDAVKEFKAPRVMELADSDTDVAACLRDLKEFTALATALSKNPNLRDAVQLLMTETDSVKSTATDLSTLSRPFSRKLTADKKAMIERARNELIYFDFEGDN